MAAEDLLREAHDQLKPSGGARAKDAENVAFEDVLRMGMSELRRMTPALEDRAIAASKIADQAVAEAADAIAIASAAQGRLHTLQAQDLPKASGLPG
jgi:hypothetical protein